MEEDKRKKIEDKLRQMILLENKSQDETQSVKIKPSGARVIRRRKGLPDMQIV